MENNIKTLYKLEVKLKTALHIGKGSDSSTNAAELLKDGNGDYFIPGTTIAGIFFDRLLDLKNGFDAEELFKKIQDRNENNDKETEASSLVFRSSYFKTKPIVKIRDRVKIDNERKVAVDGAKFSYWEIEPEDISFNINIEIDNLSKRNLDTEEYSKLENYVENIFASWKIEGFAIGAFSSSGNGWCELKKIEKFEVNKDNFDDYLEEEENYKYTNITDKLKTSEKIYDTYNLTIKLGSKNNYGLDALLIAGGDSHTSINDNDVDDVFINTGTKVFIPGSSLKGAFGFFMEKYGQENSFYSKWQKLLGQFSDENEDERKNENKTMGAGNFLVEDLFLLETGKNKIKNHLLAIERHKEDEFTRAIYGSGKFNEERLFNSTFKGKIRIRITLAEDMTTHPASDTATPPKRGITKKREGIKYDDIDELIDFLKQGMEFNLISLGANSAYPKFKLEKMGE